MLPPQYVCHAEVNAILNKNSAEVAGCSVREIDCNRFYPSNSFFNLSLFPVSLSTAPPPVLVLTQIYVGLFPCNECAKVIIQSGIQEVVYMSDKYADTSSMRASRRMFTLAKVSLRQYTPSEPTFTIDFSSIHGTKQEDVTRK